MTSAPRPEEEKGRILPFRRRGALQRPVVPPSPVEDVGKYAVSEEPDNYRQRMINNGLAFAFCILLVAIGVWLATSIAEMRTQPGLRAVGSAELRERDRAARQPELISA